MNVASWDDVATIITGSFEVVIRGDDWLGLVHRDGLPDDQQPVKVKVAMLTALGQPYVTITADVLEASKLPPETALAINHALPVAALESEDDRILLRATVPMLGLGADYLRRITLHVARQAAHMQATHNVHTLRPALFAHYVE